MYLNPLNAMAITGQLAYPIAANGGGAAGYPRTLTG
mgnify:CR=1 FL=1